MNNNELPQEDKELIAKIDERLKHYKLITDNEQQAPVEWKVCEWAWLTKGKHSIGLITEIQGNKATADDQNGFVVKELYIHEFVKPTKEEIEQHLVKIAEKKYPVGTKVKCLHDCQDLTIGNDFTARLEFDGASLRYTKEGFGATAIWCENETNKWAKIISEPITEQKERFKPCLINEEYWIVSPKMKAHRIVFHNNDYDNDFISVGNCFPTKEEADRAAQAIRETLKNL